MTNPESEEFSPKQVNAFHSNSDVNTSQIAQHHSLGLDHNQASAGDHNHDGVNSKLPLKGRTIGFPLNASNPPTQAQVQSCIDALRELGAGS